MPVRVIGTDMHTSITEYANKRMLKHYTEISIRLGVSNRLNKQPDWSNMNPYALMGYYTNLRGGF